MADLQQEHHREIEGLLENIRQLSRELRLQMLIIDNFIPQEYQVCMCTHICSSMSLIFNILPVLKTNDLNFSFTSVHTKNRHFIQKAA